MGGFSDADDYRVLPNQDAKMDIFRHVNTMTKGRGWLPTSEKGRVRMERKGKVGDLVHQKESKLYKD
ncbi:unnamed protein product [Clonostachys solani]|uniref:Uncharacterized protein n=1 Tax=Clonostachys solani TaxID=160281 RepID=A0A9N9ZGX3_9HYPO|nr:unnamed protein product [Clonostachys solani]